MSDFQPNNPKDFSGRSQEEDRKDKLINELSRSLDVVHHDNPIRHTFGLTFEAPVTVTPNSLSDTVGFVGISDTPARSDHRHGTDSPAIPAGSLRWTIVGAAESGWIVIDGTTYSGAQTTYPELWAVAPAGWKSGSSLITPDWTNRYPISHHPSRTAGDLLGSHTSSIAAGNLPPHAHGFTTGGNNVDHVHTGTGGLFIYSGGSGVSSVLGSGANVGTFTGGANTSHVHSGGTDNGPGSGTAFSTFPASVDLYMKMRAY
jgi:hypothetical protein